MAAGAATLFGCSGYAYRSKDLEVSHQNQKLKGLRERLRIVAVSDLHLPCFYSSPSELVTRINALKPGIFICAGDIVDKRGNEGLVLGFEKVRANHAKLAILGNWEYQGHVDLQRLRVEYEKARFSLMVNKAIEVAGLTLVGLDDHLHGAPDYKFLNRGLPALGSVLVISHCPESFNFIKGVSASRVITISGHTHGGQIAPFGVVFHTPKGSGPYVQGWYHKGKHSMYVSRGIGTTPGLPVRIGARPELLVLDLVGTASS